MESGSQPHPSDSSTRVVVDRGEELVPTEHRETADAVDACRHAVAGDDDRGSDRRQDGAQTIVGQAVVDRNERLVGDRRPEQGHGHGHRVLVDEHDVVARQVAQHCARSPSAPPQLTEGQTGLA